MKRTINLPNWVVKYIFKTRHIQRRIKQNRTDKFNFTHVCLWILRFILRSKSLNCMQLIYATDKQRKKFLTTPYSLLVLERKIKKNMYNTVKRIYSLPQFWKLHIPPKIKTFLYFPLVCFLSYSSSSFFPFSILFVLDSSQRQFPFLYFHFFFARLKKKRRRSKIPCGAIAEEKTACVVGVAESKGWRQTFLLTKTACTLQCNKFKVEKLKEQKRSWNHKQWTETKKIDRKKDLST